MADDSSFEDDDIPISQLRKKKSRRDKLKMADDWSSEDDDIPISQLRTSSNKKGDIISSLLSDMEKNPKLNTKLSPETAELVGTIARKYDAESENRENTSFTSQLPMYCADPRDKDYLSPHQC